MKVIDNTAETKTVEVGDIFKYETSYFLIATVQIELGKRYIVVNLTNNRVIGFNNKWESIHELIDYYEERGAVFYNDKNVALCIDDY